MAVLGHKATIGSHQGTQACGGARRQFRSIARQAHEQRKLDLVKAPPRAPRSSQKKVQRMLLQHSPAEHTSSSREDALISLLLSETVYRILDPGGRDEAARIADETCKSMSDLISTHLRLQWSLSDVDHRYMVAQSEDALYVAFMGTKQRRDILVNARVGMTPLWPYDGACDAGVPSGHRGFLQRARSINIAPLQKHAHMQGLRLVLCGHSLGGAVAQMCTLDLLHSLPEQEGAAMFCIGFATPAIGNPALAGLVQERGWHSRFMNYLLPEDVIGAFFGRHARHAAPAGSSAALSEAAEGLPGQRGSLGNNAVPFHRPLVFSRPLHLRSSAGRPLLRDILSSAAGEHSSLSLEMADTEAWVFRNDAAADSPAAAAPAPPLAAEHAADGAQQSGQLIRPAQLQASSKPAGCVRQSFAAVSLEADGSMWGGGHAVLEGQAATRCSTAMLLDRGSEGSTSILSLRSFGMAATSAEPEILSHLARLERGSIDSNPCSRSASSDSPSETTASSCSSSFEDMWSEGVSAENNSRPIMRAILRKTSIAAVLPAALAAYASIGQQCSLRLPPAVTHSQSMPNLTDCSSFEESSIIDSSATSAGGGSVRASQRISGSIFWMHRLPVYRARIVDIFRALSGEPLQAGKPDLAPAAPVDSPALARLADDVAPAMRVDSASVVGWDALPAGGSCAGGAAAWLGSIRAGVVSLLSGVFLAPSTAWPGIPQRLLLGAWLFIGSVRRIALGRGTAHVLIAVRGRGLSMCSAATLHIPGVPPQRILAVREPGEGTPAPAMPVGICLEGVLSALVCLCHGSSPGEEAAERPLLLTAEVPQQAIMRLSKASSGSSLDGLRIQLRSDFQTFSIPLTVDEAMPLVTAHA